MCMCRHVCECAYTCMYVHIHVYMHIHIHTVNKKETKTNHNNVTKNQRRARPTPPVVTPCISVPRGETVQVLPRADTFMNLGELNSAWTTGVIKVPSPIELYMRAPHFAFPY